MQDSSPEKFRSLLAGVVARGEEDISLGEAALYIAGGEYPDLDVPAYMGILEELGREAAQRAGTGGDPRESLGALSSYLFDEAGFQGNRDDYYDPDNSLLNRVLDRRLGIPITLSIVFSEVALRLGLVMECVGLPGHFILRHGPPEWELYVDPFNQGRLMSRADCERVVNDLYQGQAAFQEEHLRAYSKKQTLVRMLSNLKHVYHGRQDYHRAISAADLVHLIDPDEATNLRERASFRYQLKQYRSAIADLELYLNRDPQPIDANEVREQIRGIWSTISRLN